jgi:L-fuconolactonase
VTEAIVPIQLPHPLVRPDWLGLVEEDVIDPDRPIIDAHHHLWDDLGRQTYLLDELAADAATAHNVVATVYVQAGWRLQSDVPFELRYVGETKAAADVAKMSAARVDGLTKACAGIVSYADLRSPDIDAVLDAHVAAGDGYFRGIRQSAARDAAIAQMTSVLPPIGLLKEADFQRGLRRLGERGFTFDAWQFHPQLNELLDAARAADETRIVVDHIGGPLRCGPYRDRHDSVYRDWLAGIEALAQCPNVYVKLGGLGMTLIGFDYHENVRPPTSERLCLDWKPWIEPCIEAFGPQRCMFESNFPVDKGMFSYRVVWNAFKRLVEGASDAEKGAMFCDTARRFYKL